MKIKSLFFPLAFLVAHTCLAQSNPSSPNSQSAVASVSPSGVFISSYQENDQEDYYFPPFTNSGGYVFPSYSYSDINFTHWTDGKGGDGQWMFDDGPTVQWSYTWPSTSFPQPLPSGTGVETYLDYPDIPPYTRVCNPPTLAQEHCNFSVGKSPFMPTNMQRTAETKMKLATGGAAGSTKMNLWVISATATAYSLPWAISGAGGGWASSLTGTPIASQNISILGKTLGNDGNLYVLLPDNATPDATPVVTGGADFYSFTISAQKSKLHITANGYPLADDRVRPLAYYCVGQKLDFEGVFSPSPSGLNYTSPTWNYTADYINNHWTDANGCEEYNIAPIPAMSNPTTAWFYNKQTQDATANLGLYCKFNNGQSVYLVRQGKFNVFTPDIQFTSPSNAAVHLAHISSLGVSYPAIQLGDDNENGAMAFTAVITTKNEFEGQAEATQLVNRWWSRIWLGQVTASGGTGGNFDLDADPYPLSLVDLIHIPGDSHPPSSPSFVGDRPGIATVTALNTSSATSINDQFKTYYRFRPNGNDNIWVTLGKVNWNWFGNATLIPGGNEYDINYWTLTSSGVTGPTFNKSNEFTGVPRV
jgi:hypothetical protein